MTTLTAMKARIATEMRRSDLTTQIADAISTAISAYADDRWFFNEQRSATFNTVQDQEFYTSSDFASLPNLVKIDYVSMVVGNTVFGLMPERPEVMEESADNGTSTGQPGWFGWYGRQLRLYPIPASSGWTVRVAGVYRYAAPATDGEADNFWMTEAERLIRSRAKYELATHVTFDMNMAQIMTANVTEAYDQLKKKTNKLTQLDNGRVLPMTF